MARLCPAGEEFRAVRSRRRLPHAPFALRALRYGTVIGVVLVLSLAARAEDYDRYDFTLRLPAVFSRFSPYASIAAAGNAQAAGEWSSSTNPASSAWPHPNLPHSYGFSPQFSSLGFEEGITVCVIAEAVGLDAGKWGVFAPAAAQVRSNHEQTSVGPGFEIDADYFQVPWGKLIAEDWAVGVNFNYLAYDMRLDVSGAPLRQIRSDDYGLRLGVLHQPVETVRAGLTVDYGYAPVWTDDFDPFGTGAGRVRSKDTVQRVLVRPGIAWQFDPRSNLYVDYQAGVFWNDTDTLWVHRFPIGLEHWLVPPAWSARVGTTVDTRSSPAFTAGTGLAFSKHVVVNLAYQYGMFPELRPEFGPAETFALSVAVRF
jgi:opacity protein-like surface antigen